MKTEVVETHDINHPGGPSDCKTRQDSYIGSHDTTCWLFPSLFYPPTDQKRLSRTTDRLCADAG